MHLRLYLAARDHLQQADAILSRTEGDALAMRAVIRYVVTVLDDKARNEPPSADIVPLADFRRNGPRLPPRQ